MSRRFRRTRHGVEGALEPVELRLLGELCGELLELYREPVGDDPALARLFPDGRRDDPAAAAELRELIEADLRSAKTSAVEQVLATIAETEGRVVLDDEAAELWLRALTDVRLTLGTRLEVTESTYDEMRELERLAQSDPSVFESPRYRTLEVYEWLGWLQETLVEAVAGW